MTSNNKLHFIENANNILFELVTKLKDYDIDVKVSGDYEYSKDYTSLDFVEHVGELDFSQHDKPFKTQIAQLKHDLEKAEKKANELEAELSVKENLLKIKNGLYGEEIEKKRREIDCLKEQIQCQKYAIMQIDDVLAEFFGATHEIMDKPSDFENKLQEIIDKGKEQIKKKCDELEDRHQSDCIMINQLHTALDVMVEKYQRLREIHGL